jgi:predicted nucleotidyltransferase
VSAFDTSIRDRALKQKRERLEQERRNLLDVVEKTLRENREKYNIREAYITGSLRQPHRWYQFSDVDVAVGGCSEHIFSIMGELEEATEKEVDVIDLDNHPSSDWVRRKGVEIYTGAGSKPAPVLFEDEFLESYKVIARI